MPGTPSKHRALLKNVRGLIQELHKANEKIDVEQDRRISDMEKTVAKLSKSFSLHREWHAKNDKKGK